MEQGADEVWALVQQDLQLLPESAEASGASLVVLTLGHMAERVQLKHVPDL